MEKKTLRQRVNELPPIPKKKTRVAPVIPEGLIPSLDQLLGYGRLSEAVKDERRQANKLLKQERTREALANRAGLEIGGDFLDPDHTGFDADKVPPALDALIDQLHLWAGLVVYHPDRVTRNLPVALRLVKKFAENPHLKFLCPDADIELTTEEGRQKFIDEISKARWQSLRTAKRVADNHELLRESGSTGGKRIYGVGVPFGDGWDQTKLHPVEAPIIQAGAARILSGVGVTRVVAEWALEGVLTAEGNRWTHGSLKRYLRNPRVAGWRTVNVDKKPVVFVSETTGEPVRAAHPPVLDQDTWDQLQVLFDQKSQAAVNANNSAKGVLSCKGICGNCGATITYQGPRVRCGEKSCVGMLVKYLEPHIVGLCLDRMANPPVATTPVVEEFSGQVELDRLKAKRASFMQKYAEDVFDDADLAEALAPLKVKLARLETERRQWLGRQVRAKATVTDPVAVFKAAQDDPDGLPVMRAMIDSVMESYVIAPIPPGSPANRVDLSRVRVNWR